jgi:16S rRNA (guanine527-N7)-methyltransferase
MRALLQRGLAQFDIGLTAEQLDVFDAYAQLLIEWNQRMNLTRIVEPSQIATKHFLDSLSVLPALPREPHPLKIIDVGSGAGFPGVPLKIVQPDLSLTLLEATEKKVRFLDHLIVTLNLQDVIILHARAEEAGQQALHRAGYNVAVARAVAALPVLAEYLLPFVQLGGYAIVQKGQYPTQELQAAVNAVEILGGAIEQVIPVNIAGLDGARHLVCVQKVNSTPKQYPRRAGLPAKKPL